MQGTLRAAGALLIAAAYATPQAQTIYRCGNAYQSQPCADGKPVDTTTAPTGNAERAQAAANTKRDTQLADALQKERLRREAQAGNTFYVPPPAFEPERPSPYKTPEKAATRKLDVFTATVPGSAQAKKAAAKDDKKASQQQPATKGTVQAVKAAPPAKGN